MAAHFWHFPEEYKQPSTYFTLQQPISLQMQCTTLIANQLVQSYDLLPLPISIRLQVKREVEKRQIRFTRYCP
jgi:hypothetical protein